jgi:hypothetical protein
MFTQTNLPLRRLAIRRQCYCFLARRRLQRPGRGLRRRRTVAVRHTKNEDQPTEVAVAAPPARATTMTEANAMTEQ